eukprot:scaffold46143_cov26-Tisochrysis_lutea.AAC.10
MAARMTPISAIRLADRSRRVEECAASTLRPAATAPAAESEPEELPDALTPTLLPSLVAVGPPWPVPRTVLDEFISGGCALMSGMPAASLPLPGPRWTRYRSRRGYLPAATSAGCTTRSDAGRQLGSSVIAGWVCARGVPAGLGRRVWIAGWPAASHRLAPGLLELCRHGADASIKCCRIRLSCHQGSAKSKRENRRGHVVRPCSPAHYAWDADLRREG